MSRTQCSYLYNQFQRSFILSPISFSRFQYLSAKYRYIFKLNLKWLLNIVGICQGQSRIDFVRNRGSAIFHAFLRMYMYYIVYVYRKSRFVSSFCLIQYK